MYHPPLFVSYIALSHIKTCGSPLSLQVLRDGVWAERDAEILVPGDIISIKLGDIVPADARLLEGDPLKIDQVLIVSSSWLYCYTVKY